MKKILITEDDETVARIYRKKFEDEEFEVVMAVDGKSAIQELESNPPDALLIDLTSPQGSGLDVLKFARAQEATRTLPIIVLANAYQHKTLRAAAKEGANKCLYKATCTPTTLVDEVRSLFRDSGASALPLPLVSDHPVITPPLARVNGHAVASADGRGDFQQTLVKDMLSQMPQRTAGLRKLLQGVVQSDEAVRPPALLELYRGVHSLTSSASISGCALIAQMSSALEALIGELHAKPAQVNPSTLHTVSQAVDFLGILAVKQAGRSAGETIAPLILVVDDESISRETVCTALGRAHLRAVSVEDPKMALILAGENRFDLIFLDVEMPEMNGFELCRKIRQTRPNAATPVVFVTSLTNFEARAQSAVSGGTDLIAKPIVLIELAVKALIHLFRGPVTPAV